MDTSIPKLIGIMYSKIVFAMLASCAILFDPNTITDSHEAVVPATVDERRSAMARFVASSMYFEKSSAGT